MSEPQSAEAQALAQERDARERERTFLYASSPLFWLRDSGTLLVAPIFFMSIVVMALVQWRFMPRHPSALWSVSSVLGGMAATLGAIAGVPLAIDRLLRPRVAQAGALERAFLASQPFPISGETNAYGRDRFTVMLYFSDRRNDSDFEKRLAPLIQAAGLPAALDVDDDTAELEFRLAEPPTFGPWMGRQVLHDVIQRVLVPLHAERPIARVELG